MNRWLWSGVLAAVLWFAFPFESPAPLVYRPGEGWIYEQPGGEGRWTRTRASEQLDVAREAFEAERYGLAIKAARRTVRTWPMSDYAPEAQHLMAQAYEERGREERAFKEYQILLERYPKAENYQEVVERQFEIANQYLDGKWFRLWGTIPLFRSMERTVQMYEKVIKNGPYSDVAPQAQLNIGTAREKQTSFFNKVDPFREALEAYLAAADRYFDNREIASEALFRAANAYFQQARKADYDQTMAGKAIATFGDFITLYPTDPRVPEARALISQLRTEQARGSYATARYYEKRKRWSGALIYYNEVLLNDSNSPYAEPARQKIEQIRNKHIQQTAQR
jgi:outer membrane protein assembly factor BamD (BamD/ComL family)